MSQGKRSPGKLKTKSDSSLKSKAMKQEIRMPSLDQLELKIFGLWMSEEEPHYHAIKITFFDQLLVSAIIKPFGLAQRSMVRSDRVFAKGSFSYDPSDYEKMCRFANVPLVVQIQPLKTYHGSGHTMPLNSPADTLSSISKMNSSPPRGASPNKAAKNDKGGQGKKFGDVSTNQPPTQQRTPRSPSPHNAKDISCCNIDILALFLDQDVICVKKRLQPMRTPSCLHRQSWDNLPLLMMSIVSVRSEENARHHLLLQNANWMKVSVIGAYNLLTPYNPDCFYTAASKIPICNEMETEMVMYSEGTRVPPKFNSTSVHPRWETLRLDGELFCKTDDKIDFNPKDVTNPEDIPLDYYINHAPQCNNTIWGSSHRGLLLGNDERRLWKHLRQWQWPLELHFYGDVVGGFSFMGFMDLFPLLYPGVRRMVLAVPLIWFSGQLMFEKCNCGVLLAPNDKLAFFGTPTSNKPKTSSRFGGGDSIQTSVTDEEARGTGADDRPAFVLVEVLFHHSMVPEAHPPFLSRAEMMQMLSELQPEKGGRHAHMRDPNANANWVVTLKMAKQALRRVPYRGTMDMCEFNRQLNETRTRVEIMTSFFLEATKFVNNNLLIETYLESEETYQEMLMTAHVAMMKKAVDTLVGKDEWYKLDPALRAARHARQMNDLAHASELYMLAAVQNPFDADCWRELATCLQDVDTAWAEVCLNKSLELNMRHPLTILSKGCMVFEKDPDEAEPFFTSLINLYPFSPLVHVICIAYCTYRELFILADTFKELLTVIREQRLAMELNFPRTWERELGDYWDPTVLLPGTSHYLDAADVLLRLRAIRMADVCLGLALVESGQTAPYFHLLGVSCLLKGQVTDALCFVQKGIEMFGQDAALRCLEAECYHQLGDTKKSLAAYEKVKGGTNPHSILMSLPCWDIPRARIVVVELLRRHPNAYAWMALATDWLLRTQMEDESGSEMTSKESPAQICAVACAVQALKWDRRAGRAWALLATLVKSHKRRCFCASMAIDCGYSFNEDEDVLVMRQHSQESACQLIGIRIKDCRCGMCDILRF